MADRQGRDCSVLESALGNESMVTLLELWYMQAMYSGDVDSVDDFSKAGRDPTEVMLDGTMPLLLEVELSLEMYQCLWRHCVRREREEGVMEVAMAVFAESPVSARLWRWFGPPVMKPRPMMSSWR